MVLNYGIYYIFDYMYIINEVLKENVKRVKYMYSIWLFYGIYNDLVDVRLIIIWNEKGVDFFNIIWLILNEW